eukprot:1228544-Pyramimonas_sp.AAC.1
MSFGEFKSYVACKVLGHALPVLYNVAPPSREIRQTFQGAVGSALARAKANIMLMTLESNGIVVGPRAKDD